MLAWFEHSQVYRPDRLLLTTGAELKRSFETVDFTASDGVRLHAWFFPASPNSARSDLAVLYCHGNGGNIGYRLGPCSALLETGINVFMFDYRGYGRSAGRPSEEGTYLDAQAAFQWLRGKGFDGANIAAFGESLGGGIASELALREPVGGLVLQSTFTSIPDIGAEFFPWLPVRRWARIRYETVAKLPRLKIPVLVMHSRADELVRFRHAQRNFAAANPPKLLWELSGDHNNPLTDRALFVAGVEKFLSMLSPAE